MKTVDYFSCFFNGIFAVTLFAQNSRNRNDGIAEKSMLWQM
jgi:hypothetical protein